MRKFIILCLLLISNLVLFSQSSSYKDLGDNTGVDIESVLGKLKTYSDSLRHALPSNFRSSFRVYTTGFYLHSVSFEGGIPLAFQKAVDFAQDSSQYYLVIGRQVDKWGVITRYWVDLKLPTTDSLDCLENDNVSLLRGKLESLLFSYQGIKSIEFAKADTAVIVLLKDELQYIVHCCHVENNGGDCNPTVLSDEEILKELYERGYEAFPITVTNIIGAKSDKQDSRTNCNIEFYTNDEFNIGGITNCDLQNNLCNFFLSLPNNYTHKVYVTDNTTFNDNIISMVYDFSENEYDFAAHFHIYDSNDDEIPDLILYYDYSTIDLAWCETFNTYAPHNLWYTPFQFAGEEPIPNNLSIPEKIGFWRKVWLGQGSHIIKTNEYAIDNNIPTSNIFFFDISESIDPAILGLQIGLELNLPVYFSRATVNFSVIYEPELDNGIVNEYLHIFRSNNISSFEAPWYGWNNGYFHCGNTVGADWDLFWKEDGEPLIDQDWANEYLQCPNMMLGGNPGKIFKNKFKSAAAKTSNGFLIYSYKVGDLIYYGFTSRTFKARIGEHVIDLRKQGKALHDGKWIYEEIPSKEIAKGIEQLFISWHKYHIEDAFNGINSINPHRIVGQSTRVYKKGVEAAYEYLKSPGIELPVGYKLDDMYDAAKTYFTQKTSLPW
jgi:hypothetical protein